MIEADHHPSLHVDFVKFLPKLASYVNYLFFVNCVICDIKNAKMRMLFRTAVTPVLVLGL